MEISRGRIIYQNDPFKLIVEVDNQLGDYYRSLIPKHYRCQKPMYDSHISVLRNETPIKIEHWNKYQNLEIDFEYDPFVFDNGIYFWLNVPNKFLEELRLELGLTATNELTKPPDGTGCFHITIANTKHLRNI